MIIKIEFEYEDDAEYMVCPTKIGRNIRKLQQEFDKWMYDRKNSHPYWEVAYEDEKGNKVYGVSFNAEAFVYWLNKVRFKRENFARLIEVPNQPPKKTIKF